MTLISHDEAHHLGDHQSGSGRARKGRPDAASGEAYGSATVAGLLQQSSMSGL